MAKRKLTNRQQSHVERIQEKRRLKHEANAASNTALDSKSDNHKGRVIIRHGQNLIIRTETDELKYCLFRQNIGHLVCGDHVLWQETNDNKGVVTAILPRETTLSRPDFSGNNKAIASNVSLLVVVLAPKPAPAGYLLDQYLIAAELNQIDILIAVNKADLVEADKEDAFYAQFKEYENIGYPVIKVSAKSDHGLDELVDALKPHTSILVGQSGVGKSSLINALIPNQHSQEGRLSTLKDYGRHTTSTTTLFQLPTGGEIIDSPGVRSFRLGELSLNQLESGFKEFSPFLRQCKFSNCMHQSEPGCAIQEAVEQGDISQKRLGIFLNMAEEMGLKR